MRLLPFAFLLAACGGGESPFGHTCSVDDTAVDSTALSDRCTAKCVAAIGCLSTFVDENGDRVCELVPACRPGITPKQAANEMFECEGSCLEFNFAADHPGSCGTMTEDFVDCFEAVSCDAFAAETATAVMDSQCPGELACLDGAGCFGDIPD